MAMFFCGIAAGLFGGVVLADLVMKSYRTTLKLKAEDKTAEKIGENFYYIVKESEFNHVKEEFSDGTVQ